MALYNIEWNDNYENMALYSIEWNDNDESTTWFFSGNAH